MEDRKALLELKQKEAEVFKSMDDTINTQATEIKQLNKTIKQRDKTIKDLNEELAGIYLENENLKERVKRLEGIIDRMTADITSIASQKDDDVENDSQNANNSQPCASSSPKPILNSIYQLQKVQHEGKMHIENQDALKSWLTPVLEPLCDADPTALAKYVVALLKKDKPQTELYGCMADQLDVFLGIETKPFLERLFEVIKSQEYVTSISSSSASSLETEQPAASTIVATSSQGTKKPKEEEVKEVVTSTVQKQLTVTTPSKSKSQEPQAASHPRDRRRRISNISRSRSRSRSKSAEPIRNRRSRSRDRMNYPTQQRDKPQRYRGDGEGLPAARRYDHGRKNDRVSPKPYRGGAVRRSRSRSTSPTYRKSPKSQPSQPPSSQEEFFENKSKRCRDFDEKGYCMRGETCPWDHGVDPVVLEDLNNPQLAINAPAALNIRTPIHSEYNPDAPDLWNRGPFPPTAARMMMNQPRQPYFGFRGAPGGNMNPFMPGMPRELISVPVMGDPNAPNQINDAPHMKRRFENDDASGGMEGQGPKRKIPIGARLGPRVNNSGGNPSHNCSLELRKIPRGLNAISHLNDHFSKFGKITNIQIAYENDPEAAIVTFSSHAEANVAYRSTEAVLNNRFIKVFWHTGSNENSMSGPTGSLPKPSELSVRRFPYQTTPATPATPTEGSDNPTESASSNENAANQQPSVPQATTRPNSFISQATVAAQQQRIKTAKLNRATNEMIRKKQKEQQKEVVQLAHGLYQKKQELLQKYLTQMKQLLEKLEKADPLDPQRGQLMDTIKSLQGIIDKLKHELETDSQQIVAKMQTTTPPQRKTKEQAQKELLDVELELISKEQHGDNDTYAIQKRYMELQKTLRTAPGAVGGTQHFPQQGPRPTVARFGSTSVDRRPTTVKITGFTSDESDSVLGHFKHFGEITKNVLDESVPYLVLSYSTRINAEQALARGRQFKDKVLTINWFVETKPPTEAVTPTEDKGAPSSDVKLSDDVKMEEEKKAAVSDDEEIEEEEERSWRRGYDGE